MVVRSGIVTGGAAGIGEGVVERMLADGHNVVAVDRDEATLDALSKRLDTSQLATVAGDIAAQETADRMVATCLEKFGSVDFMVNSAGISGPYLALDETPFEDYEQVLNINLSGTFLAMRATIAAMKKAGKGGAIVNISSLAGLKSVAMISPYCASKFGVLGLTYTAAVENAPAGIRVNAICPGMIQTPMMLRNYGEDAGKDSNDPFGIPMLRRGQPSDIANAAAFLISDQSSYITGVALPVDGGLSAI
ncbi:SDR family NAD(P)-dependent oxidoreductase [Sphingomonas sp. SRS2]|uniref:SDR family NAD(P)-dependent oxidoreductase n=1 Tax=Sphingomonas sp. SRS2 TaxID=133190 RepID=UPI000B13451F|nr:SDR family oxidoreductase [Sphingomonas sp. SRS2]